MQMQEGYRFLFDAYRCASLSWYVKCTANFSEAAVWIFAFTDGSVALTERRNIPDGVERYPVEFSSLPPICRARIRAIAQKIIAGRAACIAPK